MKKLLKKKEVAAKVAEKQRENGKRKWIENREFFNNFMNSDKHTEKIKIKVDQINLVSGEIIKTWDSAADIERELGFRHANISACCKGKKKTYKGFIWKYAKKIV